MSTRQVERLEALLARVQSNRALPRDGNGSDRIRAGAAPVVQPAEAKFAVAPPAAVPPPAAPPSPITVASQPARARPAPTPLEMALESRASRQPEPAPTAPAVPRPVFEPAPSPVQAAPVQPAATGRGPREGRVLAEPVTAEPSKPIVHVVSMQPPHAAASFGELLRRSLSLRPR